MKTSYFTTMPNIKTNTWGNGVALFVLDCGCSTYHSAMIEEQLSYVLSLSSSSLYLIIFAISLCMDSHHRQCDLGLNLLYSDKITKVFMIYVMLTVVLGVVSCKVWLHR